MPRVPVRLGLTGGVGSGKSTVTRLFGELGGIVVDADAIARACTEPGGAAMPAILAAFGPEFVASDGTLDRRRMRELVFSAAASRQQLESIVHPCVKAEITRQVHNAQQSGANCMVLDIPLLVESSFWRSGVDNIIVVDCLEATQIQRVIARDGLDVSVVKKIMSAQASRSRRLAAADTVLFNDSVSLTELAGMVAHIAGKFGL